MFDVILKDYEIKKSLKKLCFKVSHATCIIMILNKILINVNTFHKA